MKFILYFIFTTIYGLIGLGVVIYYVTNFIKKKFFDKLSDDIPGYITFFIMQNKWNNSEAKKYIFKYNNIGIAKSLALRI